MHPVKPVVHLLARQQYLAILSLAEKLVLKIGKNA
jgi:hypothetical protein